MAVYCTVAVHMLVAEGQEYQLFHLSVWAKAPQALTTRHLQSDKQIPSNICNVMLTTLSDWWPLSAWW